MENKNNIDFSKVTDNPKVVELIKKREEIENKIRNLDLMALLKYEIEILDND